MRAIRCRSLSATTPKAPTSWHFSISRRAPLNAGADKVSINTAGVQTPGLIEQAAGRYGCQCIVVAIDARMREPGHPELGWEVFTHGGRTRTGIDAVQWARRVVDLGAGEI